MIGSEWLVSRYRAYPAHRDPGSWSGPGTSGGWLERLEWPPQRAGGGPQFATRDLSPLHPPRCHPERSALFAFRMVLRNEGSLFGWRQATRALEEGFLAATPLGRTVGSSQDTPALLCVGRRYVVGNGALRSRTLRG